MRKLFIVLLIIIFPLVSLAGGLSSSFSGSRFPCNWHSSTVACFSKGITDRNNNLQDLSGSNIVTFSEELDHANWTKVNATISPNVVPGPRSDASNLNADLITPIAADSYVYQDAVGVVGTEYTCAFALRSVTGNIDLDIHVYNQTHTAIRESKSIIVTPYWGTFYVSASLLAGDTHAGCSLGGGSTLSTGENLYAVRGNLAENNQWNPASGPGVYHYTDATTKPLLNLGPTNAPGWGYASFQGNDGNRAQARRYDGATNFDSRAHHDAMNINDQDHTYTFVVESDTDAAALDMIFAHYVYEITGLGVYTSAGTGWIAVYNNAGDHVNVTNSAIPNDGKYHIVQLVRSSDIAVLYVDDVPGTPVNVAGYGIDGAQTLYIGAEVGALNWKGDILYTRIDSSALSVDRLNYEREVFWGIVSNMSGR